MNTNESWALLWSQSQNALHIEPVGDLLSKNRVAYTNNADLTDYQPIYIGDKETCRQTADAVRSTIKARDVERTKNWSPA